MTALGAHFFQPRIDKVSIVKMRQTNHKRNYLPLIFDRDGFEVVTD